MFSAPGDIIGSFTTFEEWLLDALKAHSFVREPWISGWECIKLLQNDFFKQRYITFNAIIPVQDRIHPNTHLCRIFFAGYINDGSVMTLTYFMQRSNLGAYAFEWKKCYKVNWKVKLATNEQINRRVMFFWEKNIELRCLSAPAPELYTCTWLFISNNSETAWPIKAKFHVEPPGEEGTKVYINGPGHMTKMAAMLYLVKTFKYFLLWNQKSYDLET